MKRIIVLLFFLPLLAKCAQPNVPLYVHWDGSIAAPTQFLSVVFKAGGGITLADTGTNLTISAVGGGLTTTNFVVATATDLTNLVYLIGANSTNFAYAIGANGTNFAYSIGANATNFSYQIGANGTNFTLSTGLNLTNLIYAIGANLTNFTYQIGSNSTNYVNGGFTALSNLIYQVGLGNTNYTDLAASNRVTVAAGANITVTTNGSGGVMTYTVSSTASGSGGGIAMTNIPYTTNTILDLSQGWNDYYMTNALTNAIYILPTNLVSGTRINLSILGDAALYTNYNVYFDWAGQANVQWLSITNGTPTTTITSNKVQFYSFQIRTNGTGTNVIAAFKEQP